MINDPRSEGFNYSEGWGGDPKPPVYATALHLAHELRAHASLLSDRAWKLDMAIRDVRLATLGWEKSLAVHKLELLLDELTQET